MEWLSTSVERACPHLPNTLVSKCMHVACMAPNIEFAPISPGGSQASAGEGLSPCNIGIDWFVGLVCWQDCWWTSWTAQKTDGTVKISRIAPSRPSTHQNSQVLQNECWNNHRAGQQPTDGVEGSSWGCSQCHQLQHWQVQRTEDCLGQHGCECLVCWCRRSAERETSRRRFTVKLRRLAPLCLERPCPPRKVQRYKS